MLSSILPLALLSSWAYASPLSPQAAVQGAIQSTDFLSQGKLQSEQKTTFDGQALAAIPDAPSNERVISAAISQAGWTITVDSAQDGNPGTAAIDGNTGSFWHTQYTPTLAALPHTITIDMQQSYLIGRITYLPRQDGSYNGNIGQHVIQVSGDGNTFTTVAFGTYLDDNTLKTTTIQPTNGRYVRILVQTEAGGRGPWTTAAEFNVYADDTPAPDAGAGKGVWTNTIDFPVVPVSMGIQYTTGNVIVWSSYSPSTFGGSNGAQTITATWNPANNQVTQTLVTSSGHDMFCAGQSLDFTGRFIVTGGNTDAASSIYDPGSNAWTKGVNMKVARGYQSQTTTSTGNTFIIGASWSGGQGGKNGELFNPGATNILTGAPVAPMLTADAQGVYRADNHAMLFAWKNQYVFQAGPSVAMNWYNTAGAGGQSTAGRRTGDTDAMCGNAAMFDAVAGKILVVGGSRDYQNVDATSNAFVITLPTKAPPAMPTTVKITNMAYQRAFANSVVLPDGTVFIVGGQVYANPFSDDTAQLTPELFLPATNTFTQLAPMSIPRTYHSTALLLPDATIIVGGGGLCGACATNHYDAQIYNPPYLYAAGALAARPVITATSSGTVKVGATFTATTGGVVRGFSLVRYSTTTHTVNTDQRRIPLTPTGTNGNTYTLQVPGDAGVAVPGAWMLFAIDAAGVPSVSKVVSITP